MQWNDTRFIAFDFETTGDLPEYALQPWRRKQGMFRATSISIARVTEGKLSTQGALQPTVELMEKFLQDAIANDQIIIGWNTAYDISVLLAYGLHDLVFKAKWLDGMLLWRHLEIEPEYAATGNKRRSFGLKEAVRKYLPQHAGYEEDVEFHGELTEAQLTKLQTYNDRDTAFTWVITKALWKAMQPKQLKAALIEAQCLPMVALANLEGMPLDVLAARELEQHLLDQAQFSLTLLRQIGVDETVIRSTAKLRETMFDTWGITPIKTTPKGDASTDQETLVEIGLNDPRVAEVRRYRDALLDAKKYAATPLQAATYNGDDRVHPLAITFGTYSGRFTYASSQGKGKNRRQIGIALHQIRRDPLMRSIIVAPKGYKIVEFDAAGQEFRWMAIASGDETMLELCQPGEDPHSYMGAQIAGIDYKEMLARLKDGDGEAKLLRQLGKVANLSLQYRTSANKLLSVARVKHMLDMTEELAERIHGTYQEAYKKVPKYWEYQIDFARSKQYVETFGGRRVTVRGNWYNNREAWSMGSTAINYRIQGTGADQKYLALAVVKPYLTSIGAMFAWDLHDGIYFYVPENRVEEAVPVVQDTLNNLPYERAWGLKPPIPLPWDCKVGTSWGGLKEWRGK